MREVLPTDKGLSAGFVSFKAAMDKIGIKAVIPRPDSNRIQESAVEPVYLEKIRPEKSLPDLVVTSMPYGDDMRIVQDERFAQNHPEKT